MLNSGNAEGCADGIGVISIIVPDVGACIGTDQLADGFVKAWPFNTCWFFSTINLPLAPMCCFKGRTSFSGNGSLAIGALLDNDFC